MAFFLGAIFDTAPDADRIKDLMKGGDWLLGSGLSFIYPEPHDRACRAPPGFIPIFYHMVRGGFRLPILRFQRTVIREFDVQPALLLPNAWTAINAFDLLCYLSGIEPSIELFFSIFKYMGSKTAETWAFGSLPGKN